jgi:hypothetical protein
LFLEDDGMHGSFGSLTALEEILASTAWNAVRRGMEARGIPSSWEAHEREIQVALLRALDENGYYVALETRLSDLALGPCDLTIHAPHTGTVQIAMEVKKLSWSLKPIQNDFLRLAKWVAQGPADVSYLISFLNGKTPQHIQQRLNNISSNAASSGFQFSCATHITDALDIGDRHSIEDRLYMVGVWRRLRDELEPQTYTTVPLRRNRIPVI